MFTKLVMSGCTKEYFLNFCIIALLWSPHIINTYLGTITNHNHPSLLQQTTPKTINTKYGDCPHMNRFLNINNPHSGSGIELLCIFNCIDNPGGYLLKCLN